MPDLPEAILRRIDRAAAKAAGMQLGTVTTIDATNLSLTVTLPAGLVSGVRWAARYAPTVGDFVIVIRLQGQWIVIDKLSRNLTGPGYIDSSLIWAPSTYWNNHTTYPTPYEAWYQTWEWAMQGGLIGADGLPHPAAAYAVHDTTLASMLPAGATVTAAKVRMNRRYQDGVQNGAALVSPVIYGHNRTVASGAPSSAPSFVSGYGPWRPGTLAYSQAASWDLPSTWLTALLAGTITGLGVWSESAAELAYWGPGSLAIEATFTVPA